MSEPIITQKQVTFCDGIEVYCHPPADEECLAKERLDGRIWIQASLDRMRFQRRINCFQCSFQSAIEKKDAFRRSQAAIIIQSAWRGHVVRRTGPLTYMNRCGASEPDERISSEEEEGVDYMQWLAQRAILDVAPPLLPSSSAPKTSLKRKGKRKHKLQAEPDFVI